MYESILKIEAKPVVFADEIALSTFRFPNGHPFPPSYIKFCQELGYGRLCGLFLVYIPLGEHPDSYFVQGEDMKGLFETYLAPPLFAITDVPGGMELIDRAIPFARSENGDFLFWDPEHVREDGEMPVYFTDFSNGITLAGNTLKEVIERFTGPDFKSVLKFNRQPLPAIFEGFKELVW